MKSGVSRQSLVAALALVVVLPTVADAAPLPEVITIPGGPFIIGSDRGERESAYRLDEAAYGHSITRQRGWYEAEDQRRLATTAAFTISRNLITNAQYADFIAATEHAAPEVDAATWASYGLIHPYPRTRRHAWRKRRPPPGREEHPVVLVSHHDALAYAAWLGHTTGRHFKPEEQLAITRTGLQGLETITEPGTIVDLEYRWDDYEAWKAAAGDDAIGDVRSPRDMEPRYQEEADRVAAEGA